MIKNDDNQPLKNKKATPAKVKKAQRYPLVTIAVRTALGVNH